MRRASGATSGNRCFAASEKRSPIAGKYAPTARGNRDTRGLFRADPPRPGCFGLRALPADRRPPVVAEAARGAGPSGRAPLPDRASVLGALAQARDDRGCARDSANQGRLIRRGIASAALRLAL